jgi:hypothetical protein
VDNATVYAPITKSEKQADGTLLVTGTATDSTLDIDQQICDQGWLKEAMPRWFRLAGNVREMHSHIAAGVATEYQDKDGAHTITARVVDPGSVKKVEARVLKGFSIGIRNPRVITDKAAPGGRITSGEIVEVSLVDRPANPACLLTLAKAATTGIDLANLDDFDEERQLVRVEEYAEKAVAVGDVTAALVDEGKTVAPAGGPELAEPVLAKTPEVKKPRAPRQAKTVDTDEDLAARVADILKRDFTAADRKRLAGTGAAMPGGGFPITNAKDLENAVHAIGRAKNPAAAKAHIMSRARSLGREDLIPDGWKGSSSKSTVADEVWTHDPQTLLEVRNGILNLVIAEAQEALQGEREETDLAQLTEALALFLCWWDKETYNGETPAPSDVKPDGAAKGAGITSPAPTTTTAPLCPNCGHRITSNVETGVSPELDAVKPEDLPAPATPKDAAVKASGPAANINETDSDLVDDSADDEDSTEFVDAGGDSDAVNVEPDVETANVDNMSVAPKKPKPASVGGGSDLKNAEPDTVKAAVAEALAPLQQELAETRARLEQVEKQAAPGGPVRVRSLAQETASREADELRSKAARYKAVAKTIADPAISSEYERLAKQAETELRALTPA